MGLEPCRSWLNRSWALVSCLSMIFSENRHPSPMGGEDMLFGIMLARPQSLQNRHCGKTVGDEAAAGLEIPHGCPGLQAKPTARFADVETLAGEVLLEFQPLGARKHPLLAGPGAG